MLDTPLYPGFGTIVRHDPRFDRLVPPDARLEKLTEGFAWAEGPVWIKPRRQLLFSDVPNNIIHLWQEGDRRPAIFMRPSGYTGSAPRGGEPGSNGLTLDAIGRLVLCEHGDRRVTRVEADGSKTVLAERWQGKRLNSPNDVCCKANGDLYFTDPPYGLVGKWDDPARELDLCGVYRVGYKDSALSLLTGAMSRPNGLAFSPDEKTLYVANSDPAQAVWMAWAVQDDGTLGEGRVFADLTDQVRAGAKGLPDGLKIDREGNLFATGPGGVLVFAPDGALLGVIDPGVATANCAWGDDGSTLYITAHNYLCRVRTTTRGNRC